MQNLREWAKANKHQVVGEYVDAGISGKKPWKKRPALSEFLTNFPDVEALVFTKLDRFFRSVKLYYEAAEQLERLGCAWITTQEDYETVTSAGRFKVNIMLSVAESEADRTSERIKVVFDGKRARREALNEKLPQGYRKDGKRVVIDEDKRKGINTLFQTYALTGSVKRAVEAAERDGVTMSYTAALRSLSRREYLGEFYGIPDFAPALITQDTWDAAQAAKRHYVKEQKQTYIFSGLTRCGTCGGSYAAYTPSKRSPRYVCYRHRTYACDNSTGIREADIESFLLDNVEETFPAYAKTITVSDNAEKEAAALRRRAAKLQDLYLLDMISLEDLKRQKAQIDAKLAAITKPKVSIDQMRQMLDKDWKTLYEALDPMGKRMFWRVLIREIRIYPDRHIEFEFR